MKFPYSVKKLNDTQKNFDYATRYFRRIDGGANISMGTPPVINSQRGVVSVTRVGAGIVRIVTDTQVVSAVDAWVGVTVNDNAGWATGYVINASNPLTIDAYVTAPATGVLTDRTIAVTWKLK